MSGEIGIATCMPHLCLSNLAQVLNAKTRSGCSEMAIVTELIAPATDVFLKHLDDHTNMLELTTDRNSTDDSMATIAHARPDCLVYARGTLVFKGEDKSDKGIIRDAVRELGSKMATPWSPLTFGSMPYLLCYAAAGPKRQFCLVLRDTDVAVPVTREYDIAQVRSLLIPVFVWVFVWVGCPSTIISVYECMCALARHTYQHVPAGGPLQPLGLPSSTPQSS